MSGRFRLRTAGAQSSGPQRILVGSVQKRSYQRLGEPDRTMKTNDDWEQLVYFLDKKDNSYMIFEFAPSASSTIYAIQISGSAKTKMLPFYRVRLGARREQVLSRFGRPSQIKALSDIGGELLEYEENNYSFEINERGTLSSIRVVGYRGFALEPSGEPDLARFETVLTQNNVDEILGYLMPDIEIMRGASVVARLEHNARREITDKGSKIHQLLLGSKKSVLHGLKTQKTEPSANIRLRDNGRSDPVYKFSKGNLISEVVFRFHAGRWRIWEIRLR